MADSPVLVMSEVDANNWAEQNRALSEQKGYGQQNVSNIEAGNSAAANQMKLGLGQAAAQQQAAAVSRGSSPLAQRSAAYSGGQLGQQAVTQASMMQAQESAQARAAQLQNLQSVTGTYGEQQALNLQQQQAQAQAEQQYNQAAVARYQQEIAETQSDRDLAMGIAGAATGAATGGAGMAAMSDRRMKTGYSLSDKVAKTNAFASGAEAGAKMALSTGAAFGATVPEGATGLAGEQLGKSRSASAAFASGAEMGAAPATGGTPAAGGERYRAALLGAVGIGGGGGGTSGAAAPSGSLAQQPAAAPQGAGGAKQFGWGNAGGGKGLSDANAKQAAFQAGQQSAQGGGASGQQRMGVPPIQQPGSGGYQQRMQQAPGNSFQSAWAGQGGAAQAAPQPGQARMGVPPIQQPGQRSSGQQWGMQAPEQQSALAAQIQQQAQQQQSPNWSSMGSRQPMWQQQQQQRQQQGMQMSDERQKQGPQRIHGDDLDELADEIDPYLYGYKDSARAAYGVPGGPRVGVMAQDLERSRLGRLAVQEDERGTKMLDRDQVQGTTLALVGRLNERIDALERGDGRG